MAKKKERWKLRQSWPSCTISYDVSSSKQLMYHPAACNCVAAILYVKDLDRMKRFYSEMLRANPTNRDRTGLLSLRETYVSDDLRSCAYTAYYQVCSLFVSESGQ